MRIGAYFYTFVACCFLSHCTCAAATKEKTMKVSYNWLKQYITTDLSAQHAGEILTATGLEVEAITPIESVKGGLKNVFIGEVVKKTAHPNADRLSTTQVDVGQGELLPIVCGAPNVAAGQKVLVATVGATLYPTGSNEALKIKKAKIRGEESRGMICAEDELGIGESHDGIMVLPNDAVVGTPASDYLKLESDHIIEIGLTPNRTDAFCHFGVARDLAAFLSQQNSVQLQYPDISAFETHRTDGKIEVSVESSEICPRYAGLLIEGVAVKPSPEWLQKRLRSIGLTPKNNVVDVTNFVLHELGQPLHAFDADKIKGNVVRVTRAAENTPFTTLDQIERKLSSDDLMICDAEGPMCIAGVLGGSESGVTETTTRIFLESACFDATSVRKSAKRHQVNSDASFRFERGVDPNQVLQGLKRAALLVTETAGGEITTNIIDIYPQPVERNIVEFSPRRCQLLIGKEIHTDLIVSILASLDIEILTQKADEWQLAIPTYRVDVTREADVVEEILRIYGYDRIEIPQKLSASVNISEGKSREYLLNTAANMLVSQGYLQMMSNSLSSSNGLSKLKSPRFIAENNVQILNPLSSELDVMRQTLLVNMLEAVAPNRNHKNPNLRLFEFGNVYRKANDSYKEDMHLGILLTGSRHPESWNNDNRQVTYSDLHNTLDLLLKRFGLDTKCLFKRADDDIFSEGQSLMLGNHILGQAGYVRPDIATKFDIDQPVLFAELSWSAWCNALGDGRIRYTAVSNYPLVRRDFSLLLDRSVTFSEIEDLARKTEKTLLREVGLFDVYEGKNIEAGKKSYAVRFMLGSDERTLKDAEVDDAMNRIRINLEKNLGAQLR